MEDIKKLTLKRHETFSIREGWFEKAINKVHDDKTCFQKDNGTRVLGIGSNMVKSLRYWAKAAGIIEFKQSGAELTELGNLLFEHDKYLEDIFSWWLIHIELVSNFDEAPVFNTIFNMPYTSFDKELIFGKVKEKFVRDGYEVGADSSLDADITMFFKTYATDTISNPEDKKNCSLGRLGLLSSSNRGTYQKKMPSYDALDYRIVYLAILNLFKDKNKMPDKISFNIEDLYEKDNNPLQLFNISKSMLFLYLEEMKKNGYISLIKTAGLNTVYVDKIMTLNDVIKSYFRRGE